MRRRMTLEPTRCAYNPDGGCWSNRAEGGVETAAGVMWRSLTSDKDKTLMKDEVFV